VIILARELAAPVGVIVVLTWYPQGQGKKFLSVESSTSTQRGQTSSSSSSEWLADMIIPEDQYYYSSYQYQ